MTNLLHVGSVSPHARENARAGCAQCMKSDVLSGEWRATPASQGRNLSPALCGASAQWSVGAVRWTRCVDTELPVESSGRCACVECNQDAALTTVGLGADKPADEVRRRRYRRGCGRRRGL